MKEIIKICLTPLLALHDNNKKTQTGGASATYYLYSVLHVVLFMLAVYLSWSCNTMKGISVLMKVLYASVAGIFSVLYTFIYLIIRLSTGRECIFA